MAHDRRADRIESEVGEFLRQARRRRRVFDDGGELVGIMELLTQLGAPTLGDDGDGGHPIATSQGPVGGFSPIPLANVDTDYANAWQTIRGVGGAGSWTTPRGTWGFTATTATETAVEPAEPRTCALFNGTNGYQDCEIRTEFVAGISKPCGLWLRTTDTGGGVLDGYNANYQGGTTWTLRRVDANVLTTLMATILGPAPNTGDAMRFIANGSDFLVLHNGTVILSATDTTHRSGSVGLGRAVGAPLRSYPGWLAGNPSRRP